jgi:hypothetical protein
MKKNQTRREFIKAGALTGSFILLHKSFPDFSSAPGVMNNGPSSASKASDDQLEKMGLLSVTSAPFNADPTGKTDSTKAIQNAVDEARNKQLVCFFPSGTYIISDTISCEQRVQKADKVRYTDEMRQSWWDIGSDRHYLLGSTKGGSRPVIKLSKDAKGYDDPANPKLAMKIWAQTRNDFPGTHDPIFGSEQPGISFGHIFRGIDFDLSGHTGAIGLRHSGSQGCLLMDCTVNARGAFAGFNNCPGQGGGTYNISAFGGRYGLIADQDYRFPMLAGSTFKGQTKACIAYVTGNLPIMLVGCYLETDSPSAIDVTRINIFPGVSMVDCVVRLNSTGSIMSQSKSQNLFMENVFIKGAEYVQNKSDKIPEPKKWTVVARFSSCSDFSENIVNGNKNSNKIIEWKTSNKEPSVAELQTKHWRQLPSFEDKDAVNVKDMGAVGDGDTDDTAAFKKALKASKKVFFPAGRYKISETIQLEGGTQIFGIKGSSIIASSIATYNNAEDDTFFSFITMNGTLQWGSGKGIMAFAGGRMKFTENGGGRFYAMRGIGGREGGALFEGTNQMISLYTLNIERRTTNPQAFIRNVKGFRLYYLKCEASPVGYAVDGGPDTGNTPLAIFESSDVRVYCACGNVQTSKQRPFIDVVNSHNVLITHVKSFKTGDFPQVRETFNDVKMEVPSSKVAALFIRD